MDKFSTPEYERSRRAYVVQETVNYLISLLIADVFLAKLLSNIGISDGLVGIISSFISLAFVVQLLSFFLARAKTSSKKLVIVFDTLGILFFMCMYLVPFIPCSKTIKSVILMVCILIGYVFKYLVQNILFRWANSYVIPTKRASFSAVKEMLSLFSGMFFSIAIGYIIDRFEIRDNLNGGFLFIALSIFILNVCNFISLMLIKVESPQTKRLKTAEPVWSVLRNLVGNKKYRNIIILTSMWEIARYFTIGFMGIFKSKDLMMSVSLVQLINVISCLSRMLISKSIGYYADKNSYAKGFKLGLYFAAGAFLINMFTTKATWFLVIIFTILYNCSLAGTNSSSFNMIYSYVDSEYITQALSLKNCIGGLLGFGASIIGGELLDVIQAGNNMIFDIHIYGQQVLSGISFVITVTTIIFITKVVEKQKVFVQ